MGGANSHALFSFSVLDLFVAVCEVVALEHAPGLRAFQLAKLRGWTPSVAVLASSVPPGDRGGRETYGQIRGYMA